MARVTRSNAHIWSFNRGEVSTAALARTDLEPLRLAAEVQENVMPYVLGKGVVRPGTGYIAGTPSNNRARLLPFVFSVSDKALLELTDQLLRVYVNDALVTRPSVTSTVTNGNFTATDGWLTDNSGGGIAVGDSGVMTMSLPAVGSRAKFHRSVSTSDPGTQHALRVIVERGPVLFRCGTQIGLDNYINETTLETGEHSLAFTPTDGTYFPQFEAIVERQVRIDSIAVEGAGVMTLPTPWPTAQLRNLRFDQSGDVLYFANEDYQQRKVERRGTYSWSVVKYYTDTPPFTIGRTARVRLTPGATRGNTTLTANKDFFTSLHVGALFKLNHTGQLVRQTIATDGGTGGGGYSIDTIKIPAKQSASIDNRLFYLTTDIAEASGTVSREFSLESEDAGFREEGTNTDQVAEVTKDVDLTGESWWRFTIKNGAMGGGQWVLQMRTEHGGGFGVCRVTSITSSTVANVEVLTPFKGIGGTEDWQESEWSDDRGWPSGVCFFDGRLWWGGRDQIWGSVSDDYESFDEEEEGDSGPILRDIATGAVNQVRWCLPLTRLIIGTEGSEVSARASSLDEPLTPTEFTLRDVSTQGSAAVSPVKADKVGYFVQRSSKRVYALEEANGIDHKSMDMCRINDDIGGAGLLEMAVQRQPDTRIWCIRSDGQVPVLLHEPDEEVAGWVRFITADSRQATTASEGLVESVCVLPGTEEDEVYFQIRRNINGSYVRYVEKMAKEVEALGVTGDHFMADSYVVFTGPSATVTGLTHLNGEKVIAWGTSATGGGTGPLGEYTVSGNQIVLPKSCSNVVVGLKYTWRYKSAKLAYGAQAGTALLQPKKVSNLGLLAESFMLDSIQYGHDFDTMYPLPTSKDGADASRTEVLSVHDETAFPFPGSWDTDSRVCMKGAAPYPATLLGIVANVELQEKV